MTDFEQSWDLFKKGCARQMGYEVEPTPEEREAAARVKIGEAYKTLQKQYQGLESQSEDLQVEIELAQKALKREANGSGDVAKVRQHARKYVAMEKKRQIVLSNADLVQNTMTQIENMAVTETVGATVTTLNAAMLDLPALANLQATQAQISQFTKNMAYLAQSNETMREMLEPEDIETDDNEAVDELVKATLQSAGLALVNQVLSHTHTHKSRGALFH